MFEVTGHALGAQESVSQNPTAKIFFEFFDHEIWEWVAGVLLDLGLKREPVILDDFVEVSFFGFMSLIGALWFDGDRN